MFGRLSALTGGQSPRAGFGWSSKTGEKRETGPVLSGLISGTRVATAMGWRPVETILAGDKVLTFDAGLQTVTEVSRRPFWISDEPCPRSFWPIEVPVGVLGNRDVMHLLPDQYIMVESDAAEDLYGDPFSLIPAKAMDELSNAFRVPPQEGFEVVRLHFAADQVVFGKNGSLFFCPARRNVLDFAGPDRPEDPMYAILSIDEARFLAAKLEEEVAAVAVPCRRQGVSGVPA